MDMVQPPIQDFGHYIPRRYVEGISVDLIYMQAVSSIIHLAQQQFYLGLTRLFAKSRAIAAFTVRFDAESGDKDLVVETIELAPDAHDDIRLSELKEAIQGFLKQYVTPLLYESLNGKRLSVETAMEGGPLIADAVLRERIDKGLIEGEAATTAGDITIAYPTSEALVDYVRILDRDSKEQIFLDSAWVRANPEYALQMIVDLSRSMSDQPVPA